jgi:hypothetical protein
VKSFEREIREYLDKMGVEFEDHGASFTKPDFYIKGLTSMFYVEVKEKRQKYNTDLWPISFPEHHAFILDELTARKMMQYPLNGCVLVRDNTTGLYFFADVMALWLMERTRCVRNHNNVLKGKWVLDLRNFMASDQLADMFVFMRDYLTVSTGLVNRDVWLHRPDFPGERIEVSGTPRTKEQKAHDIAETR